MFYLIIILLLLFAVAVKGVRDQVVRGPTNLIVNLHAILKIDKIPLKDLAKRRSRTLTLEKWENAC